MDSGKLVDAPPGVGYLESIGHGAADCTGVTRRRRPLTSGGRHMLVAPIAATDRTTDARHGGKARRCRAPPDDRGLRCGRSAGGA